MKKCTRKLLIQEGDKLESLEKYAEALDKYIEAYSIKECSSRDNADYFIPGWIEDKIGFNAYLLGKYRTALTFGARAYRLNPSEERYKNNIPYYTDAVVITNPKERLNNKVKEYLINNFNRNSSILDIGPCWGYWSDFLKSDFPNMDAVEAFEPYVEQYNLKEKYNNLFISDARTFEFKHYDIVILGDILEHMSLEDANKLVNYIIPRCEQIIVIIPYCYPQDEIDNNEYQIHVQEEITPENARTDYPELSCLYRDELRGVYIKKANITEEILEPVCTSGALEVGRFYKNYNSIDIVINVLSNTREQVNDIDYVKIQQELADCYYQEGKTLLAIGSLRKAWDKIPSCHIAANKLLSYYAELELWNDLESFIRLCKNHINDKPISGEFNVNNWPAVLYVQMTLCLYRLGKEIEALGYAKCALEYKCDDPDLKSIAQSNYNIMIDTIKGKLILV